MAYYVEYPKNRARPVRVVHHKPKAKRGYGFAEGPLKTKCDVVYLLNHKNIPMSRRPKRFRTIECGKHDRSLTTQRVIRRTELEQAGEDRPHFRYEEPEY